MAELLARSASEPVRTGRILTPIAELRRRKKVKEDIALEGKAKALLESMGSQDFDLTTRFVPPLLTEVKFKEPVVYFHGNSEPRLKVRYTRKTYNRFGKR